MRARPRAIEFLISLALEKQYLLRCCRSYNLNKRFSPSPPFPPRFSPSPSPTHPPPLSLLFARVSRARGAHFRHRFHRQMPFALPRARRILSPLPPPRRPPPRPSAAPPPVPPLEGSLAKHVRALVSGANGSRFGTNEQTIQL